MRAFAHPCLLPPHCNASNKAVIDGTKIAVPSKYNLASFAFRGSENFGLTGGFSKRKPTTTKVTATRGRLIQKHHLQDRLSVKTPRSNRFNACAQTAVHRPTTQGIRLRGHCKGVLDDPCRPYSRDCTSHNEHLRGRCTGSYQRAYLKDGKGDQEDNLDQEQAVELVKHELQRTRRQSIGGRVPADVRNSLEVVRDAGNGGGGNGGDENGVVQAD